MSQQPVKERPILFSAPMVRAILASTKTQTRRVVKPQPCFDPKHSHVDAPRSNGAFPGEFIWWAGNHTLGIQHNARCPYGQPGDRLWVRETWKVDLNHRFYRADGDPGGSMPWTPSIHMLRWASRITLQVTGVRVERLQDISEADAMAEGITPYPNHAGRFLSAHRPGLNFPSAVAAYRDLWEQINGPGAWDANPWVWVVEFKRID